MADKRVSGFIFGRVRHAARSPIGSRFVVACKTRQGQTAASQMTLPKLASSMAFEGTTWGNEDEKDFDSVG